MPDDLDRAAPELLCGKPALTVFYWPGRDPMPICPDHHSWLVQVAGAMGLYVRTEAADAGAVCNQKVEPKAEARK